MQEPLSPQACRIHALLFMEGGSMDLARLARLIGIPEKTAREAVRELAVSLEGTGLSLVETEREVTLTTSPLVSDTVKQVLEARLEHDIGDAGLEVLATLLYRGPSTRAAIDYIRGVQSAFTIRGLLARGLIERMPSPADAREYVHRPTPELLAHLGVENAARLPDYATIRAELAAFEQAGSPFDAHAERTDGDRENPAKGGR